MKTKVKTKVAAFAGTVAAPALQVSGANDAKQNRLLQRQPRPEVPRLRPRPALIMIWRTNATSGRLDCRWSLERNAQADEGVSCGDLVRRAA